LTRLHDGDKESDIASLLAKIKIRNESITTPFAEEVLTYTQPSATGQSINKDYSLHSKILSFQKLVQDEDKKIHELKREYDKVLAEIDQFAHQIVFEDVPTVPQKGVRSAAHLQSSFNTQVKSLEEEIDTIGQDGLAQLERQKVKAAKKKKAVLKALRELEEDD
jgi:hypothetical protein